MAKYTDEESECLMAMVDDGESWESIALALGRSVASVRGKYRRLTPEALRSHEIGRPRTDSRRVSPRLVPDAARALRQVAADLDIRLGEVFTEALTRSVAEREGTRRSRMGPPFGLTYEGRIRNAKCADVVSVSLDGPTFDAFMRAQQYSDKPNTAVAQAAYALLADLGYVLADDLRVR